MVLGWCGKKCSNCKKPCRLDDSIPCSPDCENLTADGRIKIKKCLQAGCEEVKYIFDMVSCTDKEIIKKYGEIANYPYLL